MINLTSVIFSPLTSSANNLGMLVAL